MLEPLCDEEEFADMIDNMVADEAPRIFAVVQEIGDREDALIAAWGMSFPDRADVVSVTGGTLMCLSKPERALVGFRMGGRAPPRLIWVNPDTALVFRDVPLTWSICGAPVVVNTHGATVGAP